MTKQVRISYSVMAVLLVLIAWLHLGVLMLTALFGYLALGKFRFGIGSRWSRHLALGMYLIVVIAAAWGMVHFTKKTYVELPTIVEAVIPRVVEYAEKQDIQLPFTDYNSAKNMAIQETRERIANVGSYARNAAFGFAQLLIGLVIAASLFLNRRWDVDNEPGAVKDSLYSTVARELSVRFETFYASFSRVIGAQITISAINTVLTGVFLFWNDYNYKVVLIGATFLCGLLPIIGNIISNTLIVGVSFTMSPQMALVALIFLIVIHKFEYFLNSKIVGDRIKNPMWLTLIGLVLGEKLMGVPGMILAPVVLYYIKVEASKNKISDPENAA